MSDPNDSDKPEVSGDLLSNDEVQALLDSARVDNTQNHIISEYDQNEVQKWQEEKCNLNTHALQNIVDTISLELEKFFLSYVRKKIEITVKSQEKLLLSDLFSMTEKKYLHDF